MKSKLVKLVLVFLISTLGFAEEIKIGVIAALSGPIAFYGQTTLNGMKLAIEQINAQGGINGQQIKLIIEDNKGDSTESVTIAKKLINVDKVTAILGPIISTNCLAVAPIAQEAKVPMLTATETNTQITTIGDYISRICFIDPFQGEVLANFAIDNLKINTAAVLKDSGSDYSIGLSNSFKRVFEKRGGKIVYEGSYMAKDTDFSSQLTAIKSKTPDVIFIPGYSEVAIMVKQAREFKINSVFLGSDGWDKDILSTAGEREFYNNLLFS